MKENKISHAEERAQRTTSMTIESHRRKQCFASQSKDAG
jgi:hypothetical protein